MFDEDGLKITAFVVDHAPVRPAVGYRFDYRGRSAVISGDTVYAPALVRVAQGADLLLHDALSPRLLKLVEDAAGNAGQQMRRRILADVPDYHATAPQAADAARDARVGALATHAHRPAASAQGARGDLPRRRPRALQRRAVAGAGRRPLQPARGRRGR